MTTPGGPFQPMPELSPEQYAALRADIETNGIIVPLVVDQHGRILDGHNRRRIADELGIDAPVEVRDVRDDDEAADLAVTLNCARRHLTREQTRQVIANEIQRRPQESDRAIARRVGCSPSTVGAIRRGPEVSNLDSPGLGRGEAERRTREIKAHLEDVLEHVAALIWECLRGGISPAELVMALTQAQRAHERRADPDVAQVFRKAVFGPLLDATMSPVDIEPDVPLTGDLRRELLEGIAALGSPRSTEDAT